MQSYLPELQGITRGLRKGRNVYEGYQRGWGLEFGGLRDKVLRPALPGCHRRGRRPHSWPRTTA